MEGKGGRSASRTSCTGAPVAHSSAVSCTGSLNVLVQRQEIFREKKVLELLTADDSVCLSGLRCALLCRKTTREDATAFRFHVNLCTTEVGFFRMNNSIFRSIRLLLKRSKVPQFVQTADNNKRLLPGQWTS